MLLRLMWSIIQGRTAERGQEGTEYLGQGTFTLPTLLSNAKNINN